MGLEMETAKAVRGQGRWLEESMLCMLEYGGIAMQR